MNLEQDIIQKSKEAGISEICALGMFTIENGGDYDVTSPAGARGLG